ncbi:hypothetical protein B1no1_24420 [Thermolongibacillus altinsuensis]|nr:hypothetical protein B1no1_24420 [Thermolongibacillus altinsuensis]
MRTLFVYIGVGILISISTITTFIDSDSIFLKTLCALVFIGYFLLFVMAFKHEKNKNKRCS